MKKFIRSMLATLSLLLLVSCSQPVDTGKAPEIVYGQDVCDRCGMIINEEKYAAAYWTKNGEARRFDDIGGMIAYIPDESEEIDTYWVHDFATGNWIRAEQAHYVLDSDLMTPMGFGIAAFAEEDQARALAHDQADVMVMPFAELLAMNITVPTDLHEAGHGHNNG